MTSNEPQLPAPPNWAKRIAGVIIGIGIIAAAISVAVPQVRGAIGVIWNGEAEIMSGECHSKYTGEELLICLRKHSN